MKTFLGLFVALCVVATLKARPTSEQPTEVTESAQPETESEQPASSTSSETSTAGGSPSDSTESVSASSSAKDDGSKPDDVTTEAAGGGDGGGGSYRETYDKVSQLMKDAEADVASVEDQYLKRTLENTLQGYLINPIIGQVGQIANFGAIKDCFSSMVGEVKKQTNSYKEKFTSCKSDKASDSGSSSCASQNQNPFIDSINSLVSTVSGCITNNRKD